MAQETIRTISPSTGEVILERPGIKLTEAHEIVTESERAFQTWKHVDLEKRKSIVAAGLALIQQRKLDLGRELSLQMGRPVAYSHKEIETMQKRADYLLGIAQEALATIPGNEEEGFERYIKKEPVGPTLVVFAWNVSFYPSRIPAIPNINFGVLVPVLDYCELSCSGPARRQQCCAQTITSNTPCRRPHCRDLRRGWPPKLCFASYTHWRPKATRRAREIASDPTSHIYGLDCRWNPTS